jgi:hypothetical protein
VLEGNMLELLCFVLAIPFANFDPTTISIDPYTFVAMTMAALPAARRYLRKADVRVRYGWKVSLSVDRAVRKGQLPPPSTFIAKSPMWDAAVLDEWDAQMALKPPEPKIAPDPTWLEKARKVRQRNLACRARARKAVR